LFLLFCRPDLLLQCRKLRSVFLPERVCPLAPLLPTRLLQADTKVSFRLPDLRHVARSGALEQYEFLRPIQPSCEVFVPRLIALSPSCSRRKPQANGLP